MFMYIVTLKKNLHITHYTSVRDTANLFYYHAFVYAVNWGNMKCNGNDIT